MTPLSALLGGTEVAAWRLDHQKHGPTWDSGEGAFKVGGRWNSRNKRVVYCSLDPATAILEVAVHKGFRTLDLVPHVLTSATLTDLGPIHIVSPADVPDPNWLHPGIPSAGQQQFGDSLLAQHLFVLLPSVVSTRSWNLLFDPAMAKGKYVLRSQETFALDPRLHPPLKGAPA